MPIDSNSDHYRLRKETGNKGEDAVVEWLKQYNVSVIARNYQIREGEIDIIGKKDNKIFFIEVKTRKNRYFALSEVITRTKQKKIIKAAKFFKADYQRTASLDTIYRFDVALVTEGDTYSIDYIPNAFQS